MRSLHVSLPVDVYQRLRKEARAARQPATVVARHAIEAWLRQRQRAAVHKAISAYANVMAGTEADLDPALEAASLEHLAEEERRAQRRQRNRAR